MAARILVILCLAALLAPCVGQTVYALILKIDELRAYTIDGSSGKVSADIPVKGYDTFGEMTRVFTYDGARGVFYMLEANYNKTTADPELPILLYTVDPTTGETTCQTVSGAVDFPSGFIYHDASGVIIMGTDEYDGDTLVGSKFYSVNPTTAVATLLSAYTNTNEDLYVGYFNDVSADGTQVYRIGYQNVTFEENPGLGVTNIDASTATTNFYTNVTYLPKTTPYTSLRTFPGGFLSLCLDEFDDLQIVQWSLQSSTPKVVAPLHGYGYVPLFGELAETITPDMSTYGALVVKKALEPKHEHWAVTLYDVASGATTSNVIEPHLIAEECSASGVGLAPSSAR